MEISSGVGRYMAYLPSPSTAPQSPHISGIRSVTAALVEHDRYLSDLLAEREKIGPFVQVLPHIYKLLNEEILRVTTLLGNASFIDQTRIEQASPLTSGGLFPNIGADRNVWATTFRTERLGLMQSPSHGWHGVQGSSSSIVCKKSVIIEIPVDKYPSYNFVGRLLGPRGNSLKRVEATTDCRVLIRGRGSIKDPAREELMRGKPGYEHLNAPPHIVIEAELPIEIVDARLLQAREILEDLLKPVDESQDYFKRQQLRELAILNGTVRDDNSSQISGSISPFHDNGLGMKRAKTRG